MAPYRIQSEQLAQVASDLLAGNYAAMFGDGKSSIEEMSALGLCCLEKGLISDIDYLTLQLFTTSWHLNAGAPRREFQPCLREGKIVKKALQIIKATMQIGSTSHREYLVKRQERAKTINEILKNNNELKSVTQLIEGKYTEWSTKVQKVFYTTLLKFPAAHHSFLILSDPAFNRLTTPKKDGSFPRDLQWAITGQRIMNGLSRFRLSGEPMVMIPSAGMQIAYLTATCLPKQTITFIPRFCLSPWEGLLKGIKNGTRDAFVHCPLIPECTPDIIDDHPSDKRTCSGTLHDTLYHGKLFYDIPANLRLFVHKLASNCFKIGQTRPVFSKIAEALTDLEFTQFNRRRRLPEVVPLFPNPYKELYTAPLDTVLFANLLFSMRESVDDEPDAVYYASTLVPTTEGINKAAWTQFLIGPIAKKILSGT